MQGLQGQLGEQQGPGCGESWLREEVRAFIGPTTI